MVGVAGFEPTASWTRTKRDTKLRHTPNLLIYYTDKAGKSQVLFHRVREFHSSPRSGDFSAFVNSILLRVRESRCARDRFDFAALGYYVSPSSGKYMVRPLGKHGLRPRGSVGLPIRHTFAAVRNGGHYVKKKTGPGMTRSCWG